MNNNDKISDDEVSVSCSTKGKWDLLVDAGCGSGQSTHLFFPYFRRIVGVDPSANQIAQAKDKHGADANNNVTFSVGVAEKLGSVKDGSANMVIAGQVGPPNPVWLP